MAGVENVFPHGERLILDDGRAAFIDTLMPERGLYWELSDDREAHTGTPIRLAELVTLAPTERGWIVRTTYEALMATTHGSLAILLALASSIDTPETEWRELAERHAKTKVAVDRLTEEFVAFATETGASDISSATDL